MARITVTKRRRGHRNARKITKIVSVKKKNKSGARR